MHIPVKPKREKTMSKIEIDQDEVLGHYLDPIVEFLSLKEEYRHLNKDMVNLKSKITNLNKKLREELKGLTIKSPKFSILVDEHKSNVDLLESNFLEEIKKIMTDRRKK